MMKKTKTTWRKVKLGEVAQNFDSKRVPLSSMQRAKMRGFYPYYGAAEIVDYINDYIYEGLHLLIAEDGTVTADGNKPMLQLANGKFWVNNHAHVIRGNTDSETKYLFYALKNTPITPYITGAVQLKLTQENLNKILIPYPKDKNIRHKIVSILSAFDDKIELNNKISRTLEQMAQAIFKEWFVKFKFPGHKKIKMINSELGKIPEGWGVKKLGEIVNIEYGRGPSTKEFEKNGYPVYGANGIISYYKKYNFEEPQIIIGCRGVVGSLFKTLPKSSITHNSLIIQPAFPEKNYLFFLLKNSNLQSVVGGSAQPQITIKELSQLLVLFTEDKLRETFEKIIKNLEQKKLSIIYENQKLAALRDLLLPKLMNGEIKV